MRADVLGLALLLGLCCASTTVRAHPSEIIILRHPEKFDRFQLCPVGRERSEALAHQYLGKGSVDSLFPPGVRPAAVIAITLHSLELAAPIADTWKLPVVAYTVLPTKDKASFEVELNNATRTAAHQVMTNPAYSGKPVIMVWEHNHIARTRLEQAFPDRQVTLSQLLNIDKLPNGLRDWASQTYDYFWIVKYDNPASDIPTSFQMMKQTFLPPYNNLPDNDWGTAEPASADAGCIKVGPQLPPH